VPLWVARDVLAPFLATRATLLLVGLWARGWMEPPRGKDLGEVSRFPWLNIWNHWDAWWYLSIVEKGYSYVPGETSNAAFFPLYPLTIRLVSLPLGVRNQVAWALAGFLISHAALLIALLYLVRLVRLDYDHQVAARAVLYLLAFPLGLYLSAVYPESLWLALVVPAFYYARRGRWWLACVLAAGAPLTRPLGVLVAVPLLVEYLAGRGFDPRRPSLRDLRPDVLWIGLIPLAFLAWCYYLYQLSGDPLFIRNVHEPWNEGFQPFWDTLLRYARNAPLRRGDLHPSMDFAFGLGYLVLAVVSWRLVRPSYAAFATVFLLVMLSRPTWESVPRFGLEVFPLFIVLALLGRHWAFDRPYLAFGLGLGGLFMAMFALGYWVA
jgi:hypothetical protein